MYSDRETQGASSQQEKWVGDSYTELSVDCSIKLAGEKRD